jgi:hypothetical protein
MKAKVETEKIVRLFNAYITAFKQYNLNDVVEFYHLPCTLHTPDKLVLLENEAECIKELENIFTQLKQANTRDILVSNASYTLVTDSVLLACVNWTFINEQGETFADFCAIYHLILIDNQLKIINVVSHELDNSITLDIPFELTD